MFKRKEMLQELNNTTEDDLFEVFIPTYRRSDGIAFAPILDGFTDKAKKKFHLVVREEQLADYKKTYPDYNYLVIPHGRVTALGSTRNFIIQYCFDNRIKYAVDMDDDIKYLHYIWGGKAAASGNPTSKHSTIKEEQKFPMLRQQVFQLMCKIAKEIFLEHPDVVLGNIRKQHFCNGPENSQMKYRINSGVTPRQIKIMNIQAWYKHGLMIPDEFDVHGEDMGTVAHVLEKGLSVFNIPCLCYDYIDEKINSVVRDPKKENRELHAEEYNALMKMEVQHYLKHSFTFPDGQYKFGDIDWRRFHKYKGSEPIKVYWKGATK